MSVLPLTDQERFAEQQYISEHVARYTMYLIELRKEIELFEKLTKREIIDYARTKGIVIVGYDTDHARLRTASRFQIIQAYFTTKKSLFPVESESVLKLKGIDTIRIEKIVVSHQRSVIDVQKI